MYGKRRLRLKENFCFYYPAAKLKALIKIGSKENIDDLCGGIYQCDTLLPSIPKENLNKALFNC